MGSCQAGGEGYFPQDGGCLGLVSSGESPEESAFLDASENGNDVFFLTASKLSKRDTDTTLDVYDARVAMLFGAGIAVEQLGGKVVYCVGADRGGDGVSCAICRGGGDRAGDLLDHVVTVQSA